MTITKGKKTYTTGQNNQRRCTCKHCNGIIERGEGYCHVDESTFVYTHLIECKDDYLTDKKGIAGTVKKHGIIFNFKISLYTLCDTDNMDNLVQQGFQQVGKRTLIASFNGLNKTLNTNFKFNHCEVTMIDTLLEVKHTFKFNHSTFNSLKNELIVLATDKGLKDRWRYN